eukprot:TRINITY_DN4929_c0_g2_i1.p2 TRINITY_DN4929_c0_g2~~TRINITY_DN4929_c0_g2_i1.p2  ORF type:complete len:201 (+),score=74.31 TRINITY_DN4929_c0_g2_i1:92-694(+)
MGNCFGFKGNQNEQDLSSLRAADADQRQATYDRLWMSYDKEKKGSLDSTQIKPLLIECVGATVLTLMAEKQRAHDEAEKAKQKAKDEAKKAGFGFMGSAIAGAAVSSVVDPSEAYDAEIKGLKESMADMKSTDHAELTKAFMGKHDKNKDGKVERNEFEAALADFLPKLLTKARKGVAEGHTEKVAGNVSTMATMAEMMQ